MRLNVFGKVSDGLIAINALLGLDGNVSIFVCDDNGKPVEGGYLLDIKPDGTVYRIRGVNPDLGFSLDSQGRINESNSMK